MEEQVLKFLKNHTPKLCTIATINKDGKPQNAVVGYAVKDNLQILINTNFHTRKWANLKANPSAALVFGWSFNELNIQYEGKAELLDTDHPDLHDEEENFFSQNIDARKFKSEDTRIIRITPTWIRLMDPTSYPPKTEEKTY